MNNSKIMKRLVGVAAAVALSVGMGAATAAPASAGGSVWDRVADCESSGNWSINTGNGFYGGLQFSRSTWKAFGGTQYASTANRASKAEQIAVARRTLAAQGPGAWPVCGRKAGLTRANGGASTNASASAHKTTVTKKKATKAKKKSHKVHGKTVRVKRGDTIAKIAKRHHVRGGWKGLWKLNKRTVKNPNAIYIGQVLRVR
ncbi:hypothetical protein GCM10009841_01670 [Microlunatus panaciterrae]|uniref:LysM repeat protein n=1 Tax=Microlunatus panaciterrae TaxID=400768 RepID=A0ABS2RMT8_9ACTN|nr:transglycosylase family protein [Microlunatus panaciterrae]MBM7799249.1 LysM repeat protein [Microlunatus panaciterrae]